MNVTFYSFSKRPNSTARPTGGTVIECAMRSGFSPFKPKLEVRGNPTGYNYMVIDDDYFYITDCIFNAEENFFIVEGERDVLATFRDAILNSTQAILRTSHADYQDTALADSLALPLAKTGKVAYNFGSSLLGGDFTNSRSDQTVIVAVAGKGFLCMQMFFYDKLISNMFYTQAPTDEIAKWVMNPSSWFIGQMGFPIKIDAIKNSGAFNPQVAWWSLDDVLAYLPKTELYYSTQATCRLHPDSGGNPDHYLNNPPYISHSLYVGGFGQIALDSNKIVAGETLTIELFIDLLSGGAKLKALNSAGQVVGYSAAQMGYDVAMASRNPPNIIGTAATALIGGAVGGVAGAIGGGIASLSQLQGAGGAITSGSMGGAGGWSDIQYSRIECTYKRVDNYGNSVVGRPSSHTTRLSNLEGAYVECATSSVNCKGTFAEKNLISSVLKGGVYLE